MKEAKLFKNGESQAVRLPKEFRMPGSSVYIRKLDSAVILIPKEKPWSLFLEVVQNSLMILWTNAIRESMNGKRYLNEIHAGYEHLYLLH